MFFAFVADDVYTNLTAASDMSTEGDTRHGRIQVMVVGLGMVGIGEFPSITAGYCMS